MLGLGKRSGTAANWLLWRPTDCRMPTSGVLGGPTRFACAADAPSNTEPDQRCRCLQHRPEELAPKPATRRLGCAMAAAATTPLKHVSRTPGGKFSARVTAASVTADVHSIPTLEQAAHAADVLILAREHLHGVTFFPAASRLHFHRSTYATLEGEIRRCRGMVDAKLLCNRYRESGTLAQLAAASQAAGLQPAALRRAARAQGDGGVGDALRQEGAQGPGEAHQQRAQQQPQRQQQAQRQPQRQQPVHQPQAQQAQRQQQARQHAEPVHQPWQQQRTTVRVPVVPRRPQHQERKGQQQERPLPPPQHVKRQGQPAQQRGQQQTAQQCKPEQLERSETRHGGGNPAGDPQAAATGSREQGPQLWVRPCKGRFRREVMLASSTAWEGLPQGSKVSLVKANKDVVHFALDLVRAWCAYRSGLPLRAARLRHPLSVYAHVAQRVQLRSSLDDLMDLLAQLRDDGTLGRMAAVAAATAGAAAAAAAAGEPASTAADAAAGGAAERSSRSQNATHSGERGRGVSIEPGPKGPKRQKQDAASDEEPAPCDDRQAGEQQQGRKPGVRPQQQRTAAAAERDEGREAVGAKKKRKDPEVQQRSGKDRLKQQQRDDLSPPPPPPPQQQQQQQQQQPQQPQQVVQQGEQSAPAAAAAAALPDSMPDGVGAWWALNRLLPLLQTHVPVAHEQRNEFALHFHSAGAEEQQGLYGILRSCLADGNTGGARKWVLSCTGS